LVFNSYVKNTLRYDETKCINCGMCSSVCPHGVFVNGENRAELKKPEACMECGACQLNCPVDAIAVDSGVGCAAAMMRAALKGKKLEEASCGCTD
jgi:NAD-dependent dihydropyrimidine dehydrogenase PreA subunit